MNSREMFPSNLPTQPRGENRREAVVCPMCGNPHSPDQCPKLVKLSELPANEHEAVINQATSLIRKTGIGKLGEEATQKLLNGASNNPETLGRVTDAIALHYRLGTKVTKEDRSGQKVEGFEGSVVTLREGPYNKGGKLKIDDKPIGWDKDFQKWFVRVHPAMQNGTYDPYTRVYPLRSLLDIQN